jgi:hypothetical protein
MLTHYAQEKIFERFVGKPIRKSINSNFSFEQLNEQFKDEIEDIESFSNVIFFDICDFSNKVQNLPPVQVSQVLDEYYSKTMKYIKQYKGQIDKIMGDGIIVVFSKIFKEIKSDEEASNKAFYCCKDLIEELYKTEFEIKASIGSGKLFFCKTGVEQIYEEFTAVGYPYTVAYRLENIAERNQILLLSDTKLSERVKYNKLSNDYLNNWEQKDIIKNLKGLKSNKIHLLQY